MYLCAENCAAPSPASVQIGAIGASGTRIRTTRIISVVTVVHRGPAGIPPTLRAGSYRTGIGPREIRSWQGGAWNHAADCRAASPY